MAGGATQEGLVYLLNLMRKGELPIDSYFIALVCQNPPGFSADSAELDEPDEVEYARAEMQNDSSSWDLSDNVLSNSLEITFPVAVTEWGQINYWAICDQPQEPGGRVLFSGQFDEPLFVEALEQVYIPPNSIGVDMGGNQWMMVDTQT